MEISPVELEIWEWAKANKASVMRTAEHFDVCLSTAHDVYKKGGAYDRDKESQRVS
jgi:hypothetical protein